MQAGGLDANRWRDEICRVGRSLYDRGYVHASAGNISVRLDTAAGGGFLITPTDACLGQLDPATLAHVADDGSQHSGLPASKTLTLHRGIYAADAQARCVIHTHSTHLVALTLQGLWHTGETMPALTPYFVMKVGRVPLLPYHRPGSPLAADAVGAAIGAAQARGVPVRAVMLDRLGPNVWHDSPAAAMAVLEELEETARLWLMTQPAPLSEEQIDELRLHFGARW